METQINLVSYSNYPKKLRPKLDSNFFQYELVITSLSIVKCTFKVSFYLIKTIVILLLTL